MNINREALEQPFPDHLLRSRKGPFGQTFSYVEGAEVIRRLNEALEAAWSFEIIEHQVRDDEVVVLGKLTTHNITKMAFGGSSITISRDGEILSIADDLKAAATDALKKAASMLGVGLHMYGADRPHEPIAGGNGSGRARSNGNGNGRSNGNGNGNGNGRSAPSRSTGNGANGHGRGNGNGNGHGQSASGTTNTDRITQRQLSAIWSMARSLGQNADAVRDHALHAFGVQPEQLSRIDASAMITEMGEALGKPAS